MTDEVEEVGDFMGSARPVDRVVPEELVREKNKPATHEERLDDILQWAEHEGDPDRLAFKELHEDLAAEILTVEEKIAGLKEIHAMLIKNATDLVAKRRGVFPLGNYTLEAAIQKGKASTKWKAITEALRDQIKDDMGTADAIADLLRDSKEGEYGKAAEDKAEPKIVVKRVAK